tara:strand:+ start:1345 stop:2232 length:888 start_codon:yes stop_codon:yes gene_type:complete
LRENIIILGAQGFIGINLIKLLSNKKINLIGVGNKSLNKNFLNKLNCKFICTNIFEKKLYDKYININSTVIFLASIQNKNFIVNFTSLINHFKKKKIKKIIFLSSSSLYGNNKSIINEEAVLKPINSQGHFFLKLEKIIAKNLYKSKISTIILRVFNVYGPYRKKRGLIEQMIISFLKNEKINIQSKSFLRSYIGVKDLCKIIDTFIKYDLKQKLLLNVYNKKFILSFDKIYQILKKQFNKDLFINYSINKKVIKNSVCKSLKISRILKFKMDNNFNEEIIKLIKHYKKNENYFV